MFLSGENKEEGTKESFSLCKCIILQLVILQLTYTTYPSPVSEIIDLLSVFSSTKGKDDCEMLQDGNTPLEVSLGLSSG